jgi:hypothetical protein
MAQPRKYASHAQRQAAYHQRRQEARERQLQEKGLPALPALPTVPGTARWRQAIGNAAKLLGMVAQEMQQYHDERSDGWQESDRGTDFQSHLESLIEVQSLVEDLLTA